MNARFDAKTVLALGVTVAGVVGITVLAMAVILVRDSDVNTRAQLVLNAVLPLFGTWVGTVLAYYFGRENYQSGSDNTIKAVRQLSLEDRLRAIPVTEVMTKRIYSVSAHDAKLQEIVDDLDKNDYKRLPILNEEGAVDALLYREHISRYLLSCPEAERAEKTVQDLLDARRDLKKNFACVGEEATLAEAREAMNKIEDCKVVFVTENGKCDGVVVGLITNSDIAEGAML
jgi:predicted transcriptional regulator